jgi:hypothetical protein
MKLESVRAFKAEIAEEIRAQAETPEALSFYASTEPPMPKDVALGLAKREDGEHIVAIRTSDPELGEKLRLRAVGEADVKIITVEHRTTSAYYQARRRPLVPGLQVGMANKNFVGTLGCFVRDALGILYILSNSHVLADQGRAAPGWQTGQPFGSASDLVCTLSRFVPYSPTAPNLVDAAIARVDSRVKCMLGFNPAFGNMRGSRAVTPDDLGREVIKGGRTTGAQRGRITATEVDGLPVAMDLFTPRFNDQLEITGGPETDFSAGGDSGSLIIDTDGWQIGLLFAGGFVRLADGTKQDFTYANHLVNVEAAFGVKVVRAL